MTLHVVDRFRQGSWAVTTTRGSPGAFHALELPPDPRREVWVHEPDASALVLGSTQPDDAADARALARRGVALVRRHSGGGAVLVEPGALTWVDVILPAGDPLWRTDVGGSFHWLGEVWLTALTALGVAAERYDGPLVNGEWGRLVCFAGLGPGEVTAPPRAPGRAGRTGELRGPKLVGMAQRRTRAAARFQCAVAHRWEPRALLDLLVLTGEDRRRAGTALADAAAVVPGSPGATAAALLSALP